MLVNDSAAISRLNSPLNLINRLSAAKDNSPRKKAMSLFVAPRIEKPSEADKEAATAASFNPFEKTSESLVPAERKTGHKQDSQIDQSFPTINQLIDNNDAQIKLATAHDSALEVLTSAVELMKLKLDDVKAEKLPAVITATSKVVESIRRERNEAARSGKGKEVHYHFYTPQQKKIEQYDVIEVS